MVLEFLLLKLGTSTAKAVARMWIKSDVGLAATDSLVDSLGARVPGLTERRRTARQFEDMAERIAHQLAPLVQTEYGELPPNELEAAVLGVAEVIDSLQLIDARLLFALDLEPISLESALRKQPTMRVRNDLIDVAKLVFDRLLRENCNYIVELTMSLPKFTSLALAEVLKRETEIIDRVRDALARIPQPAELAANADEEFDVRYRRYIARELDRLELFGLTLSESSSRYDLSIAYITLGADAGDRSVEPSGNINNYAPVEERSTRNEASNGSGATGLKDGFEVVSTAEEGQDQDAFMRVDEALARGKRHLIRGEAGSGKTTLLQWLAVTAARDAFEGSLEPWSGSMPIFIQLRRYANKELPLPEQFLMHAAGMIAGVMPVGWIHRQLATGNAMLLIDGVDELPVHQRKETREWLLALLREFPDCRFVVTTRPPAVPENWLDSGLFEHFELLPMSVPDILSFIHHWYDAARRASAHIEGQAEALNAYEAELMKVIRDNPAIRSLATAPLLCAMLCALNRDRRTQLPRDRMELYRVALESLLDRRDAEREISQQDEISLGLREKEALLQDLAYWLILNDQTDVEKSRAIARVSSRLDYMSTIKASAERIFSHLLTRSGLIREPVEGRIDFIHRTFQEYLGAARAVSEGNIPMLIARAHDDHWREVIILSAGHANASQRDELLLGLLDRGFREEQFRHRLHLLAVACLETAIELSPATQEAVREALTDALPPSNMTEARAVASAGPLAAPLLDQYHGHLATISAACVRALCLIGGDTALQSLKAFRGDRRVTVIRELIRGWEYFDRAEYAAEILSTSKLDHGSLTVTDVEQLGLVGSLVNLRYLTFRPSDQITEFSSVTNIDKVRSLDLINSRRLPSLQGLDACVSLERLRIYGNHIMSEFPRLPLSLKSVDIEACTAVTDLGPVVNLPQLQRLTITSVPAVLGSLASNRVQYLVLNGCNLSKLSWLTNMGDLRALQVAGAVSQAGGYPALGEDGSCSYLSNASRLQSLSFWPADSIRNFNGLPPRLRLLRLSNLVRLQDASAIGNLTALSTLMLDGASNLADFSFLRKLRSLRVLDLERSRKFEDLSVIASLSDIFSLRLTSTSVKDLAPLAESSRIRELHISRCPIESLDPLRRMRAGMTIYMDLAAAEMLTDEIRTLHRIRITRF